MILPAREQLVDRSVQGLPLQSGTAGKAIARGRDDSVLKGRGNEDPQLAGEVHRQPLDDEAVRSQWQMWPVLFEGADREDQPLVSSEPLSYLVPRQLVQRV